LKKKLRRRSADKLTKRRRCAKQETTNSVSIVVLVLDNHFIDEQILAFARVMDANGYAELDPRLDCRLIKSFPALGHVCDRFSELIRRGPLVSLSAITLPGVYSVMVPLPVVVVVVVVVLEVCPQANGATNASAMLSIVFFTLFLPY
jgi:hypothetical protein